MLGRRAARRLQLVMRDVEAGKAQAAAAGIDQDRNPGPGAGAGGQREFPHQKRRGDAEIQEIRQRIQLRADLARRPQAAGQQPVQPVDGGGKQDQDHGEMEIAGKDEADRRQPGAKAQQRDHVRDQRQEGQAVALKLHLLALGATRHLADRPAPLAFVRGEIGDHGFPGHGGLAHRH